MHKALLAPLPAVAPRRSAPAAKLGEDAAERDADRRADRALAQQGLACACACGGGCPLCRPSIAATADAVPSALAPALRDEGEPLSAGERAFMEPRLGADFGAVRVHTGATARAAAAAVDAEAFAFREHLFFGAGRRSDTRLLAHELAHVVQQRESGARLQRSKVEGRSSTPSISGTAPPAPGQQAAPPAQRIDPSFWEWWKRVNGYEGTLQQWRANRGNKNDKGGETNHGVTKETYHKMAKALGLDPSDAAFEAMTPDQAMLFGMSLWKASGASRIKNPGVAMVIADWYWGGIILQRLTDLLKAKGFDASYDMGTPSKATTDFMNTLPPDELLELMSDAKAEQYKAFAKADPSQQGFLGGWLKRSEERREQARTFAPKPAPAAKEEPQLDLWERAQRALRHARGAEQPEQRSAALAELDAVIAAIDQREARGFAHAEEAVALRSLRDELKQVRSRLKGG